MRRSRLAIAFATALILGGLTPLAYAIDGVTLITQNTVISSGGFPFQITRPGSYRLASNLTVPDANTTAILITADNVSLDLNGFTIQGPTVCSGSPLSCTPKGSGNGVDASGQNNITVVNGTVQGMGNAGIVASTGLGFRVEKVHATSNGSNGIQANGTVTGNTAISNGGFGIAAFGTVTGNMVLHNGGFGIAAEGTVTGNMANQNGDAGIGAANNGSTVTGNTANFNAGPGIAATGTVTGNTVIFNAGFGLALSPQSGYALNVISGNAGGTVSGGVSLGHNLCNGIVC